MPKILPFNRITPILHDQSFVAAGAVLIGDIQLGEGANIWYNCTVRADVNYVRIGRFSNIQDNSVIHEESPHEGKNGNPTLIGDYVTVGHGCILHACTIEDFCLIGMGAVVLDGAVIGKGSIVGAGAVVTKGTVIPPFSVVLGTPGKVVKTLPESSLAERLAHAEGYWQLALKHK